MLLLIRIVTAMVLFVFLFVFAYFAICFIGGALSGAFSGAGHPGQTQQEAYESGGRAGREFVRGHLGAIALSALFISLAGSCALSFSGILPWCKKRPEPPPLP